MSELLLGSWQKRPYGFRADGVVDSEHGAISVTVREPATGAKQSGFGYVMANGWTAGKGTMRAAAVEGTRFGHTTVTLDYTNCGNKRALDQNADNVASVIDALPSHLRRAAMGLSMGGATVTMALTRTTTQVETATLVAPGKYISEAFYTRFELGRRAIAEVAELVQIGSHPSSAIQLGLATAGNCTRRRHAIWAELHELIHGNVHDDFRAAKAADNAPFVRFAYALQDGLLPAYAQRRSVEGLPFDDILPFEGRHARLAYDSTLARSLFQLDADRFTDSPAPFPAPRAVA